MPLLAGTKIEKNLKVSFACCSQANCRYLYFARKAILDGYNDISAVFRSTAEGEGGQAVRLLQFLEEVGDPATDKTMGATPDNLRSAITGSHETTDSYPGMAGTAREEGFDEIADWFELLARAEQVDAVQRLECTTSLEGILVMTSPSLRR